MLEKLDARYLSQVRALWAYCFQEDEKSEQWYFENRYPGVQALGETEGGALQGMLHLAPYTLQMRGCAVPAAYVGSVSVWPHARGRGVADRLMRGALERLRNQGIALAPLKPFAFAFYQKYGWAICSERSVAEVPLRALMDKRYRTRCAITRAEDRDAPALAEAYDAALGHYNGLVLREQESWRMRLSELRADGGYACLVKRGNAGVGGMLYRFEDGTIMVEEMFAADADAACALLGFLGGHTSTMESARWSMPPGDPMHMLLPADEGEVTREARIMNRVVDVAHLSSQLALGGGDGVLYVRDEVAPWNDCAYSLSDFSRLPRDSQADVACSIAGFTQLVAGYRTPEQLAWTGELTGNAGLLTPLFPPSDTFVYEVY